MQKITINIKLECNLLPRNQTATASSAGANIHLKRICAFAQNLKVVKNPVGLPNCGFINHNSGNWDYHFWDFVYKPTALSASFVLKILIEIPLRLYLTSLCYFTTSLEMRFPFKIPQGPLKAAY